MLNSLKARAALRNFRDRRGAITDPVLLRFFDLEAFKQATDAELLRISGVGRGALAKFRELAKELEAYEREHREQP